MIFCSYQGWRASALTPSYLLLASAEARELLNLSFPYYLFSLKDLFRCYLKLLFSSTLNFIGSLITHGLLMILFFPCPVTTAVVDACAGGLQLDAYLAP